MEIYIAKNKTQMGPYDLGQITQLLQSGILVKHDLYWHEGMLDWAPVASLDRKLSPDAKTRNHLSDEALQVSGIESEEKKVTKLVSGAFICLVLSFTMPLLLGALGCIISAPLALVGFVLGIIIIIKGRTWEGIVAIILSVICPLVGWFLLALGVVSTTHKWIQ